MFAFFWQPRLILVFGGFDWTQAWACSTLLGGHQGLFDSMQAQQQQQQPITLKELASKDKPAVQISAAAGTIASAQESLARAPHDMDQEKRDASSPASAQQHLSSAPDSSAQPDSTKAQQASRQPSSEVITVQIAVTAPKADTDALSCSSGPDSLDGLQPLKPLTPAQSSEHSPGSSTQEQRAVIASSASMASSPAAGGLSCEVCNISTTSLELLQQHLQGRRHLKILAVQNPAADADARQAVEYPCDVCNVVAASEGDLAAHLDGKRHRKHVQMAEVLADIKSPAAPAPAAEPIELHCELCDVTAPTQTHKELHLIGQKHQRREKQAQHLDNSEELSHSAVAAVLSDGEQPYGDAQPAEHASNTPALRPEEAGDAEVHDDVDLESNASSSAHTDPSVAEAETVYREVEFQGCGVPSAFADPGAFESSDDADVAAEDDRLTDLPKLPLQMRTSGLRMVRFSQSFDEDDSPEDDMRRLSSKPPLAPSGGSVSLAAQHFCPVCGIIATSQDNLEDHMRGRRHARRLQYIRNMPESERTPFMERVASGDWHVLHRRDSTGSTGSNGEGISLLRIGSITLPSSMDLRQYLEQMQEVGESTPKASAIPPSSAFTRRPSAAISELAPLAEVEGEGDGGLSEDPDAPEKDIEKRKKGGEESPHEDSASGTATPEYSASEAGSDSAPRERHECVICGITTTSAAHLEAHLRGRKHKRRADVVGVRVQRPSSHYCKICDITTTSAQHMAMHVAGKAHCRRLATGHLPAAAQGVALDADPVVESARKEMPKGPAPGRPALPGSSGPMHPSVPPPPPRAPSALINRLAAPRRSAEAHMQQAQRAAPAGSWAQPAPPRQGFQQRASPQPQAMHSAAAPPFWQENTASQQVFYDPQQVYTAVPGHHSATDYPAGQAWQQWSQVRPSAAHTGVMHQPQVVSAQAMYPAQPVYPGSMAVPQYGYMPQQAMYHQSLGAYAGNGSIYSGNGNAYAPSAREYQQSQAQLDYNCQVCGTTAPDLDSYRQHVRAKQHMRRVQNRHSAHM
ncbi:g3027 [Coccomyxa viridis]|uniref:G3027 protein n=1 Tax=Coccomyxa viridis TaxID=1274662 RepID=A0ABP1FLT5_9CHLO